MVAAKVFEEMHSRLWAQNVTCLKYHGYKFVGVQVLVSMYAVNRKE